MEVVDKLLAAKFIREVYYPEWQANVVMAKKSNGEWRMCVDFTNLNKTCLKNSFPLPQIDQLVDLTARHEYLSFIDAFFSYNQIMMDEQDQEKIAFIASQGLYYHKVMPFGLKTASATYQRLVNCMFHDQIERNIGVYVDDMLVKPTNSEPLDRSRNFQYLPKVQHEAESIQVCVCCASEKFLGFMVSQRGIEANPNKVRAIIEMLPLMNVKEVQHLSGQIATFNRFVS